MRKKLNVQRSLFEFYTDHDYAQELKGMSRWLDEHEDLLESVVVDLHRKDVYDTGRQGMPAESVLRCAILKQYWQLTYQELAFHLSDSQSFQSFARLPVGVYPKKSVLQQTISRVGLATWEKILGSMRQDAVAAAVALGNVIRIDSTVCETDIHEPADSSLLWDSMKVMVRLLEQAEGMAEQGGLPWRNHARVAKKRVRAIHHTRGIEAKVKLYKDLVEVAQNTLGYLEQAQTWLAKAIPWDVVDYEAWLVQVGHYKPLIARVLDQTRRRVFHKEKVPAQEKLYSLFEPHTDIVIKDSREIQYGHKLNLSSGRSGLILDVVIEQGNPADSERLMPMLQRHKDHYGCAPRQVAVDGGYASRANLEAAKGLGVSDMAFHKKRGLQVEDMAKSPWVYRKLKRFRAGIESGISCLKRAYGLARCTWKGMAHYQSYVWSSVVAYNLALFARLRPKPA